MADKAVRIPCMIGAGFGVGAMADAGIAVGPTDRLLLYGTGGALVAFTGGGATLAFLVGGGAAVATGDRMSLFTEFLAAPGAGCCFIRTGVNFAVR